MADIDLANRFKIFIEEEFPTQIKAAQFLNKTQSVISRMVRGTYAIDLETIQKLHREKNLDLHWFFGGKGSSMKAGEKVESRALFTDLAELKANMYAQKKHSDYMAKQIIKLEERISKLENKG